MLADLLEQTKEVLLAAKLEVLLVSLLELETGQVLADLLARGSEAL